MTIAVLTRRPVRDGVLFDQFRAAAIAGDELGALAAAITIHEAAVRVAVRDIAIEAACVAAFINHLLGDAGATIQWARRCLSADPSNLDHPCAPLAHALYAAAAFDAGDHRIAAEHTVQARQLLASDQPWVQRVLAHRLTNFTAQRNS